MSRSFSAKTYKDKDIKKKPWYFLISGKDENGERLQVKRRGFATQKEAKAAMKKVVEELESGVSVKESEITFAEYMEEYLENRKRNLRETTFVLYRMYYREHLNKEFGSQMLKEITPRQVQNFINALIEVKKLSSAYVREVTLFLKLALKHAVKPLKLIKENPVDDIELPHKSRSEINVWNKEQIELFVNEGHKMKTGERYLNFQYHYFLASATSLLTGMRKGEVLGLRWEDIDYDNQVFHIRQIVDPLGKIVVGAKTKSSLRSISVPVKLLNMLKELQAIQEENQDKYPQRDDNNLVFKTRYGTKLDPRQLLRSFKEIAYSLGLPIIRFHDLRHSHATLLLQQNVNAKIVANRLGHTDVTTTLNIYSHVLPSMQQEVADKLDDLF